MALSSTLPPSLRRLDRWPIADQTEYLEKKRQQRAARTQKIADPVAWAKKHFYIEDRFDMATGEQIGAGAIILAPHQERIIDKALERDASGRFRWTTIVYSAVKKSGKTRLAAMVAGWLAQWAGQYAEVYCLANDGKQSADRVLAALKKAVDLSPSLDWRYTLTSVRLPSGAFIEAVPVDPTGEAGSQPTGSFWSEMWGFRLSNKERLWTEMTIPPTRFGRAIRWVESYAGYTGESPVLENLYHLGVVEGVRHPAFPKLPVYVNERARLFCYWDEQPRMIWQTPEYYAQEADILTETEFLRIHRNQWVSSESTAIPLDAWDARQEKLPPTIDPRTPVIIGVDLSVSGDYTALVAVTWHPTRKDIVAIRMVRVWKPPSGGKIDYSTTIEPAIRNLCKSLNVVCVAYDMYQAEKMMQDLRRAGLAWFHEFPQGKGNKGNPGRTVADKMFYDFVMAARLVHNGDPTLREHVANAAAKTSDEKYLRFVKKAEHLKIDALVAASMAVCTLNRLNL